MLGLGLRCEQVLALECTVCERLMVRDGSAVEIALFGAVAYAQCPGCGRAVGAEQRAEAGYRRRARVRRRDRALAATADDQI